MYKLSNFEIWKQKYGERDLIFVNFNKGRIGKFGIGTIWILAYGEGGKRRLWVVTRRSLFKTPALLPPVLLRECITMNW